MTRNISIDFGSVVTSPQYQLVAANGSLGSAVTTGFSNITGTGIYVQEALDTGSSIGIYWTCATDSRYSFYLWPESVSGSLTDISTEIAKIPRAGAGAFTYTNQTSLEADSVAITA